MDMSSVVTYIGLICDPVGGVGHWTLVGHRNVGIQRTPNAADSPRRLYQLPQNCNYAHTMQLNFSNKFHVGVTDTNLPFLLRDIQ
jgi:hypothetical protein